jgi:hypothetical protein
VGTQRLRKPHMVTVPSFSAGAIGSQAYIRRRRPNPIGGPGQPNSQ